jgi:hypothetical protein
MSGTGEMKPLVLLSLCIIMDPTLVSPQLPVPWAATGAGSVQRFRRMLKGAVWIHETELPGLQESLGHFYMKMFTLEIKLYLGFLVSPPPCSLWEVSESYCGDQRCPWAVSIQVCTAGPAGSFSTMAPRDPVHVRSGPPAQHTPPNTHTHTFSHLGHFGIDSLG